ncbi:MAG: membrane protein insertase YidC [Spirochaetota bacterium]
MDKRTLLAVVLSVLIMTIGFSIQSVLFAPDPNEAASTEQANTQQTVNQQNTRDSEPSGSETQEAATPGQLSYNADVPGSVVPVGEDPETRSVSVENDVFVATLSSRGAVMESLKMKQHRLENGDPVEMIFRSREDQAAFYLYFGDSTENPVDANFNVLQRDDFTIEFYRDFSVIQEDGSPSPNHFRLKKTFVFNEKDYLFEIYVTLENTENKAIPLNDAGDAYTLAFEPQIGPEFFEEPDGRYRFRDFYTFEDGDKNKAKLSNGTYTTEAFISWAALTGKYFTVIGVPDATRYEVTLAKKDVEGLVEGAQMYFTRPTIRSSMNTDVFRFYIGPILDKNLSIYNDPEENGFGLSDLQLEEAVDSSSWLGWLESILKWLLRAFYSIVPNYGVAIILLTILIKIVLFPFTKKSFESTAKMATLSPQMEEIKAKYKDNPNKMNAEMAQLYKREKVNPMGGCLPMLLQFPVFIALYGLLNKHFELRGAVFIPGWITDLSLPESIYSLPFSIPFLGSEIRALPILYVISMIFSMKISQSATAGNAQAKSMNKMMIYFMPAMLFFVLYNAPSGLLLYWFVMNLFTMLQQKVTNRIKVHQVEEEKSHPEQKIVKKNNGSNVIKKSSGNKSGSKGKGSKKKK